jgi:lysophospholipase L1-like esterase
VFIILKKLISKTSIVSSLIVVFLFSTTSIAFGKNVSVSYDYVSIGDSLAAGQTPFKNNNSYGYTNIIAEKLDSAGVLGTYGDYGISGLTASDVLSQVTYEPTVIKALSNSEIVTLDVGANDILKVLIWASKLSGMTLEQMIYSYPGSMTEAQLKETLSSPYTLEQKVQGILMAEIMAVQVKIEGIIKTIAVINPNAKVYVMGYYNALPAMPEFLPLLDRLNSGINYAATVNGATYVATQESMDKHLDKYLPGDIHPTVQGYRAIAQDFWKYIQKDFLVGLN